MEAFFFFLFAFVAVVSAVLLVLFRNPVYCALSLVGTFFALAGLFVLLEAYFLAAVQVIVYAGAIMVLFLFVIMLLNLGHGDAEPMPGRYRQFAVILLMAILVTQVGIVAGRQLNATASAERSAMQEENVSYLGKLLFTDFLFPFEVVGIILLVALIGVIVLVKREPTGTGDQT